MDTMLPLELLHILACPICKGDLIQIGNGTPLHCKLCNKVYPVVEGIPILLPEQADAVLRTEREAS
jgi:uncharacterized protein YbaR (Trm112 family)